MHEWIFGASKPEACLASQKIRRRRLIVAHAMFGSIFTTKTLIRVALTAISLNSIGIAHSATPYQAPAHNYYHNNWTAGD